MTLTEYQRKLAILMSSDAEVSVKEEAIAELRDRFDPSERTNRTHEQIAESSPDISDIGGHE